MENGSLLILDYRPARSPADRQHHARQFVLLPASRIHSVDTPRVISLRAESFTEVPGVSGIQNRSCRPIYPESIRVGRDMREHVPRHRHRDLEVSTRRRVAPHCLHPRVERGSIKRAI